MNLKLKKSLSAILATALVTLSITGCSSGGSPTDTSTAPGTGELPTIELKLTTTMKASEFENENPAAYGLKKFMEYVEKESSGKLTIKLFSDGMLAASNEETIGGIQSGAFELTSLANGSWGEYTDGFMPMNIPYLFLNADVVNKALDGNIGALMTAELEKDTGLKGLGYMAIGFRHLTNSIKPVKTVNDMSGLKIRTMSDPYQIKGMESLGASVTPTAYSELFTALQQGMVDGQENPIANIYTSGMYEVQDYMTLTGHNYTFTYLVCNKDKFDSLPQEYKDILVAGGKVGQEESRAKLVEKETEMLKKLEEFLEVYQPTTKELKEFQAKTQPVWKDVEAAMGSDNYNQVINDIKSIEKELGLN
jgi:C4-dicarboxylate-binding protein DctP